METVKCPHTGYDAYEFKVNCKCGCHEPGNYTMHFMPCCLDGFNKVYLYPTYQFHSLLGLNRFMSVNNMLVEKHPELIDLIKIEGAVL